MKLTEKFKNQVLEEAGIELMRRRETPITNIPSPGSSTIYKMENSETIRIRTCNDHILTVVADMQTEDARLNIEGTDWLLVVMPKVERTEGEIIAYLVPTEVAVKAVRQSHAEWLSSNPKNTGSNTTWCIWFDENFTGKEYRRRKHGYSEKWAMYRIEYEISSREIENAQISDKLNETNSSSTNFEEMLDRFLQIIYTSMVRPTVDAFQDSSIEFSSFEQKADSIYEQLKPSLPPIKKELKKIERAVNPYIKTLFDLYEIEKAFNTTGWLPYRSAPLNYVEECKNDIEHLERKLSDYYRCNWIKIRKEIESRLDKYHIDKESKQTFLEALSAHDAEHYRCVCRTLFPEIERAIRISFFNNKTGHIGSKELISKVTDDKYLELFIADDPFCLVLFDRFIKHFYERVEDTNRKELETNPVPNRHAALHGLIPYSEYKHSMNVIILTDYIFSILKPAPKNANH